MHQATSAVQNPLPASGDEAPRPPLLGIAGNVSHQGAGPFTFDNPNLTLCIVEFDDQGCLFRDDQMQTVEGSLKRLAGRDANIFVFVHGWKHNAKSDDSNLQSFTKILIHLAELEPADNPVPILGLFIGWRGLSLHGLGLENLTFWDRKQAGVRVALGSVRELFGRLRHFRAERKRAHGSSLLAIIGHSFGGMVVYSALAQSLIEAAAMPLVHNEPSFADLVLLVNPAFEAARYLPIQRFVEQNTHLKAAAPPIFVSVTSRADWATRFAFPLGCLSWLLTEATRGKRQAQALINTMGHISWMKTHTLSKKPGTVSDTVLAPSGVRSTNPFWVVQTTRGVMKDHNDIFNETIVGFVRELLIAHLQQVAAARHRVSPPARPIEPPVTTGV